MKLLLFALFGLICLVLSKSYCPVCGRMTKVIGRLYLPRDPDEIFDTEISYHRCPQCGGVQVKIA